jgi:1-acyl-sn-glycerol-3-phosphate acyltransferase
VTNRVRGEQSWWWRFVADPAVRFALWLMLRIRQVGTANIPRSGPALLVANHISVLDPPCIALAPSAMGRTVRFLAAAEFFDRPLVGSGLRSLNQIPVRRGAADWAALDELAAVIREGSLAGIFPEGRTGDGAELLPGQKGAARIALAAGVPVVPIGIWGTDQRWPRSGFRWRRPLRPQVVVVWGKPFEVTGDPRSRVEVRELTDRIMAEISNLVDEGRRLLR